MADMEEITVKNIGPGGVLLSEETLMIPRNPEFDRTRQEGATREYMPAKSCSCRWHTATKDEAVQADVFYNGYVRGSLNKGASGWWNGRLTCKIRRRNGDVVAVIAQTHDGYETMEACAQNLWVHFCRSATDQGLFWK